MQVSPKTKGEPLGRSNCSPFVWRFIRRLAILSGFRRLALVILASCCAVVHHKFRTASVITFFINPRYILSSVHRGNAPPLVFLSQRAEHTISPQKLLRSSASLWWQHSGLCLLELRWTRADRTSARARRPHRRRVSLSRNDDGPCGQDRGRRA